VSCAASVGGPYIAVLMVISCRSVRVRGNSVAEAVAANVARASSIATVSDSLARCHALGVWFVGTLLADATQRGASATVQLTRGLLDLFEQELVEDRSCRHRDAPAYLVAPIVERTLGESDERLLVVDGCGGAGRADDQPLGRHFVEAWVGHGARNAFELLLILAYAVFVSGVRVPVAFWRGPDEEQQDDRRE